MESLSISLYITPWDGHGPITLPKGYGEGKGEGYALRMVTFALHDFRVNISVWVRVAGYN